MSCVLCSSSVTKLCNETWIGKSVIIHCQNSFEYFMGSLYIYFFFTLILVLFNHEKKSTEEPFIFVISRRSTTRARKRQVYYKKYNKGECLIGKNIPSSNSKKLQPTLFLFLHPFLYCSHKNVLSSTIFYIYIKTTDLSTYS